MDLEEFKRHFRSTFGAFLGTKIVVALSGGADSVALLHLLLDSDLALELVAAHVHHGTRGLEANEDAAYCEQLCNGLGITFVLHHLSEMSSGPEGQEATWRKARYRALRTIASGCAADAIATGHQKDDVAEGVLVQILRGAGPRALAGIAARQGDLLRPLLPWSHNELCRWLTDHDTTWREDSSNASPVHLRNRVRHEALPALEAVEPSARRHLVRLSRTLAMDEAYFTTLLDQYAKWIDPWHPGGGVAIKSIADLDPALRVRWLHAQAARAAIGRVTHRQGELLRQLLSGQIRAITLAGRWVLRRAGSRLWLEPPSETGRFEYELEPGQTTDLPLPGWAVSYRPGPSNLVTSNWAFPCRPGRRFTIRSVQPGDLFADGSKVSSLLRRKLPKHLRRSWPILCDDAKILWIPGVEQDTGSSTGEWIVEVMRS